MRPYSPAVTREESLVSPHSSKEGLIPLRQHERFPEVPIATREDPQVSCLNLRWDEAQIPFSESRGIWSACSQLERMPDSPGATVQIPLGQCLNSNRTPSFPPQLEQNNQIHLSMQDEAWFSFGDLRAIPISSWQLKTRLDSLFCNLRGYLRY